MIRGSPEKFRSPDVLSATMVSFGSICCGIESIGSMMPSCLRPIAYHTGFTIKTLVGESLLEAVGNSPSQFWGPGEIASGR